MPWKALGMPWESIWEGFGNVFGKNNIVEPSRKGAPAKGLGMSIEKQHNTSLQGWLLGWEGLGHTFEETALESLPEWGQSQRSGWEPARNIRTKQPASQMCENDHRPEAKPSWTTWKTQLLEAEPSWIPWEALAKPKEALVML